MSFEPNSDNELDKPQDEFMFYYKAFKGEEKKIMNSIKFEKVVASYWQLLRKDQQSLQLPTITQQQYTSLMKRIYKVLLPLYRDQEMTSEISQEWLLDSKGQSGLNFALLTKLLFRIAHHWATHIDLDEYVDLLERILDRITHRIYTHSIANEVSGAGPEIYPTIDIKFPQLEEKLEQAGGSLAKDDPNQDWNECRSEESNQSDFDYKYEEDPDNMIVKKFKKKKGEALGEDGLNTLSIKDPIIYQEIVTWREDFNRKDNAYEVILNEMTDILPFGYPVEQFLAFTKNSVYQDIIDQKSQRKKGEEELTPIIDRGLIQNYQDEVNFYSINYNSVGSNNVEKLIQVRAICTGHLINFLRQTMRDVSSLCLRMQSDFPKANQTSKTRAATSSQEPITENNPFGFNPALERRLQYKLASIIEGSHPNFSNNTKWVNINYLYDHPQYEAAYRADVNKVETKNHMSIREDQELRREEEFVNVETSYKRTRQIMLIKKFDSIFTDRTTSDNRELKRLKKTIELNEKKRLQTLKVLPISQKNLSETYEEKAFIKLMRGPFFQLESKAGLQEDDFYTSAEQDLILTAQKQALKLLIIGKPRSGKTSLSVNLAQRLDLVHINVDNWINDLFARIKLREGEDPVEVIEGEEPPPKFFSDFEDSINQSILEGTGPSDDDIFQILSLQVQSPLAKLKGFILDLSYYKRDVSWSQTLRNSTLLSDPDTGGLQEFSHIIELVCEDEEILLRAQNLRANPDDGKIYSRWEREERKKPPVVVDEDAEIDEDSIIKPLDEGTLVQRVSDTTDMIKSELYHYNTIERLSLEEILINLYDNQYIKLDSASFTPTELLDAAAARIKFDDDLPLRPLPIVIEGGSDFKSLLTEGQDEGQIPRKWSLWKQTDPVSLRQGKIVQGLAEYAVHYNGNVFVFGNEDTMKAFIVDPKMYLTAYPQMPNIFRVLLSGPRGAGQHSVAQQLSSIYGWRVIDFKSVVKTKLEELMKAEQFMANNPIGGRIGLSEQELNDVIDGKPILTEKFTPWILDSLGFVLEKRKPLPPVPKEENEEPPEEEIIDEATKKKRDQEAKKKKDEDDKKRKEEEEKQRLKEERHKKREDARQAGHDLQELGLEESEEEPIIIEDLSIDQLVLGVDESTGKAPLVSGFILINYPETLNQMVKLQEQGIEFDRVIYLTDTNEEDPGAEIKKRMEDQEDYDWDWENENAQRILAMIKEHLQSDDNIKEISCNGDLESVVIRIRNEIDPYYIKIDNPDDVRVSADLGEDDKKLPKGDFGDFCPVTYIKDNWIVRGNPEQEVTIMGKTYWLSGEKEAEEFKFKPRQFLKSLFRELDLPLQAPPSRIMVLGNKGSGVTSQIRLLCDKYKLKEFNLKDQYLAKLKEEKDKRKRRRLLDRGFRPPQPAEEEGGEPPVDPEIEDDPEDFDRETHERQVMKMIFDNSQGYVIDGTWRDLPEGAVTQTLQDLLFESRRVPELVIIIKCKEQSTFKRMIDTDSIQMEYQNIIEKRAEERERIKQEDRLKQLETLQSDEEKTPEDIEADMQKWDEDRDAEDEAADENDPEKPVFDDMVEKFREALRETRTNDEAFFEEFGTALRDKSVTVIDDIKSDTSMDYVFIKLLDKIKDSIIMRKDLIEKQQAQILTAAEVTFYEKSYIYSQSKFARNSAVQQCNPSTSKKFPVLYRERLYYLVDAIQQKMFLNEPSKFTKNREAIPQDIVIKPRICILGLHKSGKSTLCKRLVNSIGVVHLKMSKIIQSYIEKDSVESDELRFVIQEEGRQIDEEMMLNLLVKRIQLKDCVQNGWVLEDFPKTRQQAVQLARKGLKPTNVIHLISTQQSSFERTASTTNTNFGSDRRVFASRISYFQTHNPQVLSFYNKFFNNVAEIDTSSSLWYVEDNALQAIQDTQQARQNFAKDYYLRDYSERPCIMKNLNMDRCLVKQSLSEFKFFCPVTWRNEKILVKCVANNDDVVLYNNLFYFFKSQKEREMFISNPRRFTQFSSFPKQQELPLRMHHHKASEIILNEKTLNGHCSVTLMDEERVTAGDHLLLAFYKDGKYVFDSEYKLQRFLMNPFKYSKAMLPVKMPPPVDKVSLFNLQKMEDSIAFMEQSIGQIVTRALREVSENRLKYPTISVKETMLKLFALFLKTENPANTIHMKRKYSEKMKQFIQKCEIPEELFDLAQDKSNHPLHFLNLSIVSKKPNSEWPQFKETYYNDKGGEYDKMQRVIANEKLENFISYIR